MRNSKAQVPIKYSPRPPAPSFSRCFSSSNTAVTYLYAMCAVILSATRKRGQEYFPFQSNRFCRLIGDLWESAQSCKFLRHSRRMLLEYLIAGVAVTFIFENLKSTRNRPGIDRTLFLWVCSILWNSWNSIWIWILEFWTFLRERVGKNWKRVTEQRLSEWFE